MGSTEANRARRRAWIQRLLRQRERQGLTLAELALQSGVPAGTLASWSARLRREAESTPVDDVAMSSVGFVELVPGPARPHEPSACFEVVLKGERRVVVPPAFDQATLERLVRALESC